MRAILRTTTTAVILLATCAVTALAEDKMPWQANLETAQRVAAETNRLVLIHFWAPWCRPCMRMEQEVFAKPETGKALEANFVLVKLNADEAPGTARLYGVSSLPSDVITTPSGRLVSQLQSPPTAAQYITQMNQAAAGHRSLARKVGDVATPGPEAAAPMTAPAAGAAPNPYAAPQAGGVAQATPVAGDPYAEYFPEGQQAAPAGATAGQVTPAQAYASVPPAAGQSPPLNDPYSQPAAPTTSAPAANPYAAPQASTNPYAAPPVTQQAPAANPYAANPHAASPTHAAPPAANPYAAPTQQPPAAANPYAGPPQQPAANPYAANAPAAQSPAMQPPAANPYAAAPAYAAQPPATPQVQLPQLPAGSPPLGLDGNCPVTLVERKRWAVGHPSFGAVHRGRTYLFLGPQERDKFLADPDRYSPVMSGLDPVLAVDNHSSVPGSREFGVFGADGKIYLFANEASRAKFEQNEQHYTAAASPSSQPTTYQAMRPNP